MKVVVDPEEVFVGGARESAECAIVVGFLEAADLVVVRLAQGVAEGAAVDEGRGAAGR